MTLADLNRLDLPELYQELVAGDRLDTLLDLAIDEDLGAVGDVTTRAHVPPGVGADAEIRARGAGVLAGVPVLDRLLRRHAPRLSWWWHLEDGERYEAGTVVGRFSGSLADLLPVERVLLNLVGRLSGIATLTDRYLQAMGEHDVRLCDTRKTTPGYRALEKYAVRCGGGHLHRIGLHDAYLLKDNHLHEDVDPATILAGIVRARAEHDLRFVEVEVDDLGQLKSLLDPAGRDPEPAGLIDIVLLDNMTPKLLREAVAWRNRHAPGVLLEASGGITLDTISAVAATGIDRIAVGALTHSAVSIDFGLDLA